MLEKEIENIRRRRMVPKEEIDMSSLFLAIKKNLQANKSMLDSYSLFDCDEKFDIDSALKIFQDGNDNHYGNIGNPYINEYGRISMNMEPFGVVGFTARREITNFNYLEVIKTCLQTRNSLVIKPYFMSKTLEFLVILINDILVQTDDFTEIVLTNENVEYADIDILLYVGQKEEFASLNLKCNKIYLGVGQYEFYIDEEIDKQLLEFAKKEDIKIYYKGEENVIDKINTLGGNYCTAIMTRNKAVAREFINRINSSYILVNVSPTMITNVNIFPEQLLKRKNVLIYD